MKTLSIYVAAWASGLATYLAALYLVYGETIGQADLVAVVFWSILAAGLLLPTVYLGTLKRLRSHLGGYRPLLLFPLVASLLCVIPAAVVMLGVVILGFFVGMPSRISAIPRMFLSPEAGLFYAMFVAVGLTFGLGFVWRYRGATV